MSKNTNIDLQEVIDQLNAGGNMSPELVEIFSEEAEEHMRTIYERSRWSSRCRSRHPSCSPYGRFAGSPRRN